MEIDGMEIEFSGKFAVLPDGRKVHYTRFVPCLDSFRMMGIPLLRWMEECYGDEDWSGQVSFPEGPKMAPVVLKRWNDLKRSA